jgi:hypothetical protein
VPPGRYRVVVPSGRSHSPQDLLGQNSNVTPIFTVNADTLERPATEPATPRRSLPANILIQVADRAREVPTAFGSPGTIVTRPVSTGAVNQIVESTVYVAATPRTDVACQGDGTT